MTTTTPPQNVPQQLPLFLTGNEGLSDEIATLTGIYQGEYDSYDVETLLFRVEHNIRTLRNLHVRHR